MKAFHIRAAPGCQTRWGWTARKFKDTNIKVPLQPTTSSRFFNS